MRHKRKGRVLGRSPSHRKAMLRNMASALFLTERDDEYYEILNASGSTKVNPPKPKGRIVTTVHKAKEVRPLVEKCITIARRVLKDQDKADALEPDTERNTDEWRSWRKSDKWNEWNQAVAPVLAARRKAIQLLGDKEAVAILFEEIAPRFEDRDGGYTRVVRLAKPRLGDAGERAILEFVGERDRVDQKSAAPSFGDDGEEGETSEAATSEDTDTESAATEEAPAEETASQEADEKAEGGSDAADDSDEKAKE